LIVFSVAKFNTFAVRLKIVDLLLYGVL